MVYRCQKWHENSIFICTFLETYSSINTFFGYNLTFYAFFVFNSIYDLLGKIIINLKLHSQNDIEKGGLCKEILLS